MWFWRSKPLSDRDRAISESIKALKTLRVQNGCVSIDPSEVIGQPGYLQQRAQAGAIVRGSPRDIAAAEASWVALEDFDIEALSSLIARHLIKSRRAGLSMDEAIAALRPVLSAGGTK